MIALLFPGQGSQKVGMGKELYQSTPHFRRVLGEADEVLGFGLSELILNGPKEELDDTINTQPALLATSIAYWEALGDKEMRPSYLAGHSLGEYSALVVAGSMSFADGLRLVRERGRLMKASPPGAMAAILGLKDEVVEEITEQVNLSLAQGALPVAVANYNCPGQVVISGAKEALGQAIGIAKEKGAKVIPLAVSIAGHSPHLSRAAEEFRKVVDATPIRETKFPIVANTTAQPMSLPQDIKEELPRQLTFSVQWTKSIQYMTQQGVKTFLEVGPGSVLTGLVRRIDEAVEAKSMEGPDEPKR